MEIKIALPQNSSISTYKQLMGYLKQFELAIHHAQKAVENAEETGIEITENCYVTFEHPILESITGKDVDTSTNLAQDLFEELQQIELQINLQ